jgi:hypothetical protein
MCHCSTCVALPLHPHFPGKHLDPATGCAPLHEWGSECARGFVSDQRFDRSARVIKRTSRVTTRKLRASSERSEKLI